MPRRRSPHGQHAEIPVTVNTISPTLVFVSSGLGANCWDRLVAGRNQPTAGVLRTSKSTD